MQNTYKAKDKHSGEELYKRDEDKLRGGYRWKGRDDAKKRIELRG